MGGSCPRTERVRAPRHRVVAVDPPKFAGLGTPVPIRFTIVISSQDVHVRSEGKVVDTLPRSAAKALDVDAIAEHARAFVAAHPDSVATVTADDDVDFQAIISAIAALRGPDCRYPDPEGCILPAITIEAGAG